MGKRVALNYSMFSPLPSKNSGHRREIHVPEAGDAE
jgi:hypothetical protein